MRRRYNVLWMESFSTDVFPQCFFYKHYHPTIRNTKLLCTCRTAWADRVCGREFVCQLIRHSEHYVISKIPRRAQDNELICSGKAEVFPWTAGSVNMLDLCWDREQTRISYKAWKGQLMLMASNAGTSRTCPNTHAHAVEVSYHQPCWLKERIV